MDGGSGPKKLFPSMKRIAPALRREATGGWVCVPGPCHERAFIAVRISRAQALRAPTDVREPDTHSPRSQPISETRMSTDIMTTPFEADAAQFAHRADAGRQLGQALLRFRGSQPLILGIPRGGIPVAAEVARALDGDLDVIAVKRLHAPRSPELIVGAVTADGAYYLSQDGFHHIEAPGRSLMAEIETMRAEAVRIEQVLRAGRTAPSVEGRTVIIVDDGLTTGSTMIAAARSVRSRGPEQLVLAVPVAPRATCDAMDAEADEVVCLRVPDSFIAIALHYRDFLPIQDRDMARLLGTTRSDRHF